MHWSRECPPKIFAQVPIRRFALELVILSGRFEKPSEVRCQVVITTGQETQLVQQASKHADGIGAATEAEEKDSISRLPHIHKIDVGFLHLPDEPRPKCQAPE